MSSEGLKEKRGPQRPHTGTPRRRPLSVRRTTTHTCHRPDGLLGEVIVRARGRDLWTGAGSDHSIVADATVQAEIDFIGNRVLKRLDAEVAGVPLESLAGLPVASGFRRALDDAVPAGDRCASLEYQLLDDLPTTVLVSGVPLASAGMFPPRGFSVMASRADICAGWASGATILVEGERLGHPPVVMGPAAPSLECAEADPLAWHPTEPVSAHSTRRSRRIDVWAAPESGTVEVEAFFRDTQADAEGTETVVHEYLLAAELDAASLVLVSCEAEVGVLPWMECPGAIASAGRVVGTGPADLRDRIRQTFVGTTTCTHLNDTLRSLACLPHLVAVLSSRGSVRR